MHGEELPSFEELVEMAKESPEKLEQLRKEACESVINSAPEKYQRKLRGLQFKIDMERRRAPNPIASCVKLSDMMQQSFTQLKEALQDVQGIRTPKAQSILDDSYTGQTEETEEKKCSSVIHFPKNT